MKDENEIRVICVSLILIVCYREVFGVKNQRSGITLYACKIFKVTETLFSTMDF